MTTSIAAPFATLQPGEPVAPGYEAIAHLSRGGDLDVYDAWSIERQCRCVMKVVRPDCADRRGANKRLRIEGELLSRITHPHLVRCFEVVEGPRPAIALETLTGETLSHLIQRRQTRLPVIDLAFLGLQLVSVVGYLHRNGVLHLDVKPSNIVCEAGKAILIDLSLARPPGRSPHGCGTAQYLSPEQARGATVGPEADVWGIGATLYHAATGERPFPESANGAYMQLDQRAAAVRTRRRVPLWFAEIVEACLSPKPSGRPDLALLASSLEAPFAG